MDLRFVTDPGEFLAVAREHLAARPVVSTVVATVAQRAVAEIADGVAQDAWHWYAVVYDDERVVGAAMRTAPFGARPLFLLPMPDEAAAGLARALHARGEKVGAASGALPAVRVLAEETTRLAGGTVAVERHSRLFELGHLVEPPIVPGRLCAAGPGDLALCLAWFEAFMRDVDEQAGRPPGSSADETPAKDDMLRRIARRAIWLWHDANGQAVHLTGVHPPAFGVARIAPVYTPKQHRRHGYAGAAVAQVSRMLTEGGSHVCLFTDQANPISNKLYESLGYRQVVDITNLLIS